IFDLDVLACDEACFPQALAERGRQMRGISERGTADESDHRQRRLLRVCRERPCRRTAEQRDELAPVQWQHLPCFRSEDTTLPNCGRPTALRDFEGPEGRYGSSATEAIDAPSP